jgi:hypothetical protein
MKVLKDIEFNTESQNFTINFGNNTSKPDIKLQIGNIYPNVGTEFEVTYFDAKKYRNFDFMFTDINQAKSKFVELYNQFAESYKPNIGNYEFPNIGYYMYILKFD